MGSTLQLKPAKSEEIRCQMTSSMPVLTTSIVAWHARLLNTSSRTTSRRTPRSLLNALQRMPQNIQQISVYCAILKILNNPKFPKHTVQVFQSVQSSKSPP